MQLNIKVIKTWQPPDLYINPPPPFSGLSLLSSKIFGTPPPPQVTQFVEGPTPLSIRGEGSHYDICHLGTSVTPEAYLEPSRTSTTGAFLRRKFTAKGY